MSVAPRHFICEIALPASPFSLRNSALSEAKANNRLGCAIISSKITFHPHQNAFHLLYFKIQLSIFVPGLLGDPVLLKPHLNAKPRKGQPGCAFIFKPVQNPWDVAINFPRSKLILEKFRRNLLLI